MKNLNSPLARSTFLSILFCAVLTIAASAQTFTSLANLTEPEMNPLFNSLVQGTDGNFYGTSRDGGTNHTGSIYKVTPGGMVSVFYAFCAVSGCPDGFGPQGPLLLASDGNFYGTTASGGATNFGTIFKLTSGATLTTLHSFCPVSGCTDGVRPTGPLVQGFDGNVYGTTAGTIFKITPTGTLTTVHTFCSLANCADGNLPTSLSLARDGTFYGISQTGGTGLSGTVFHLTPAGQFTTVYDFCSLANCADGSFPLGSLVVTATGTIYGTTEGGGSSNAGTMYQLATSGTLTTLYQFCTIQPCVDGGAPASGLIQATDGKLYGSAAAGGFNNRGTVFRVTTAGVLIRLHSFDANDGALPVAALVQGTDGNIYGTTTAGGPRNRTTCPENAPTFGCGTVFRESGLKPFVKSVVRAGRVGDSIIILGNGLTGSTSVTFNGTAATFTVVSDTEITATVPTGATTGLIQVVTPTAALASNLVFRILP